MADPAVAPTDDAAPPAINDQIEAARKSGYSDQEIGDYLKSSSAWAPHFQAAAKAGYSDDEVFGHLGLNPKESPSDRTVREVDEQGTAALKRVGSAAWEGAKEAYGDEAFPSILSPEAQESLDQSDSRVNRFLGKVARDIGTPATAAYAAGAGLLRGAQQGLVEFGEAIGQPQLGRDLAGAIEAFPDARLPGGAERHALQGAARDVRNQMRAEPPVATPEPAAPAETTTKPAEPIGPESGMVVRPNPEDMEPEAPPAAPQPVPAQAAPLDAAVQAEHARTAPRTPEQAAIDEEAEAQPAPAPAAAQPEPQVPRETPADPTPAETQAGPPARYVMLRPDQLKVDPERFQYKASDEKGVTGALVGTDRWEPLLSDPITAWEDLDGQLYVVNGHQRTDLARRAEAAGQPDVQIPAEIFRAADGNSPEFMRVMGAYKNIGQGSGTAIDAARVLRGKDAIPESVRLPELPPNQQIVKQARGLAALDDHAWGMVTNGIIPPEQAAVVGDLVKDPAQQSAIMGEIARAKNPPQTAAQAQFMVQDILHSGFLDQIEKNQGALFGADDLPQTLFGERAQILDGAQRAVNRARTVFNSAVKGEDTLTGAGNKLDTAGNLAAKAENDRLIEFIRREAVNRGPLSDALTAAARDIAAGKPPGPAISGFLVEARRLERSGEGAGVPHGAVEHGAGVEGHPDDLGAALFEPGDHTFRNDPRQEGMFGGPSAVQAQAARDQAGRGGLNAKAPQKPMDEGLFAKPEAPTGDLFAKPKNRWALQPTGRETLGTVGDLAAGHRAAGEYVLREGKATGHEHVAVVDNDTGRVIHAHTDAMPGFVSHPEWGADDPANGYTIHHNHPSNSSLSRDDISTLRFPLLSHIVAEGHGGDTYGASLGPRGIEWRDRYIQPSSDAKRVAQGVEQFGEFLISEANRAYDKAFRVVGEALGRKEVTAEDANKYFQDYVNTLLHKQGLIDYFSTRSLPESMQRVLDDHVARFPDARIAEADDRHPIAIRPEERDSVLPRRSESERPSGNAARGSPSEPRPAARLRPGEQGRLFEGLREDQERDLFKGAPDAVNRGYEIIKSKTGFAKAIAEIRAFFSPTEARGAKPMEFMVNRMGAEAAADYKRAEHALQAVRWAMDKAGEATQLDFIKRYERGEKQATPEMQKLSDVLHDVTGGWTKKIQGMGKGLLQNAIDDYMGHIYSNYEQWKSGAEGKDPSADGRAAAAMVGKRPLTGSGNFLKQRTFPTLDDAIRAGLKPITTNPVDLQLMKLREMQKFYHGQRLADQIKAAPFSTFVRPGDEWAADRAGLVKLDDRIFQPRIMGGGDRGAGIGHNGGPAIEGGFGRIEPGNWYAPEPIARIFNRYMSRGLYGQSVIYDTFRSAGNALNSLQLSLSGFHAAFIMNDVLTSRLALGLRQAFSGDFAKAAGSIASVPVAPITTLRNGARLQKALLAGADAPAGMRRAVEDMMIAGGRASMDQFYRSTTSGPFFRTLGDLKHPESVLYQGAQMLRDANGPIEKAVMVPLRMAGRVLDTTMQPLMGHMVPLAKMGVFDELARDWHERHPGATPEERQHAMTQFWDSVDNRMGQLAYDRLYWNKAAKDIAFIGMRSVGWNLGSFREIVGAAPDAARYARDVVQGKRPDLTTRMSYVMAMPMVTATIGGMITYALTGAPPEKLLDYFFPLGRIIPGYMKDVIEFTKAPVQTILNKAHPLIGTGIELYHNRDYFGGIIHDPKRDPSAAAAYADYLTNQMLPFSFRNMQKMNQQGLSLLDQSLAFWGLGQAPQSIVNPERMQHFQDIEDKKAYRRREREQGRVHIFTGP